MTTSTCSELAAAMSSLGARRQSSVGQPDRDATVVLAIGGTELGRWPLPGSARPDLSVIDALAQMALGARRIGGEVGLRGAGADLLALIDFVGLADVLETDEPGRA
jgi:hypothetical protein